MKHFAVIALLAIAAQTKALFLNEKADITSLFSEWRLTEKFNEFSYSICGENENTFKLEALALDPNPPSKGQPLSIAVKGDLSQSVEAGTEIFVLVRYKGLPIFKKTIDLCAELDKVQDAPEKCPIAPGRKEWSYRIDIPNELPSSEYLIEAKIRDQSKRQVLCANAKLVI